MACETVYVYLFEIEWFFFHEREEMRESVYLEANTRIPLDSKTQKLKFIPRENAINVPKAKPLTSDTKENSDMKKETGSATNGTIRPRTGIASV